MELRAILAETEPGGHDPLGWRDTSSALIALPYLVHCSRDYSDNFCGDRARDITERLAESLAAFLGQTFSGERCRCAQGHHWSSERGYFDCGGIVP